MSVTGRSHDGDHSEAVLLYALGALHGSEARTVEERLSRCADCRQELAVLRPLVDSFAAWPTDVLRPPATLWDRLERSIRAETGSEPVATEPSAWVEPDWEEVAPGITVKLLATDTERGRVSMLVRLAPGVDYPPHRHAAVEELHLLDGELMIDDKKLYPGDYVRAEAGTVDHRVWSETGCTVRPDHLPGRRPSLIRQRSRWTTALVARPSTWMRASSASSGSSRRASCRLASDRRGRPRLSWRRALPWCADPRRASDPSRPSR
jgi:anti-sigma factor ChrR (cupin superfamily)